MAYRVKAVKQDAKRFEFELDVPKKGGKEGETELKSFSMPLIRYISAAAAEKFENGKDMGGLLLSCDNDEARDAIRLMNADQIKGLLEAWESESEDELGESSAS